jgi:hypothetical protein
MKLRFKLALALAAVLALGLVLVWNRFHQQGWVRGGVGFIGDTSAHVLVMADRNQLQWLEDGRVQRWTGKPRTESESVCFDGHKVHRFSWGQAATRKGAVIRFLPQRIEVFDLEHLHGECFSPRSDGPPEKPSVP